MTKWFNVGAIRSYNRNWNFINGERACGKTYSTLKYIINECKNTGCEFVYIVRNQNEKKSGCIGQATAKVLANEFPNMITDYDNECLYLCSVADKNKITRERVLGYCIALTEAGRVKKRSYPKVKYLIFDEYMIENQTQRYVNGWNEPDLLLNIYSTIDRDSDRVICFLLGNNTQFYNPYHLHKAFNIPEPVKGKIWKNKYCLFYWVEPSEELKTEKARSKFRQMLAGTDYGNYAFNGNYTQESNDFVMSRPNSSSLRCNIAFSGFVFGVWYSALYDFYYIDPAHNEQMKTYCLRNEDFKAGYILCKKGDPIYKAFGDIYARERMYFADMETKSKLTDLFDIIGGRSTCVL